MGEKRTACAVLFFGKKRHDAGWYGFFKEHGMRFTFGLIWHGAVSAFCACSPVVMAGADVHERIYRCGNEYTNAPAQPKDCQVMQGQTITVIQGTRPSGAPSGSATSPPSMRTKMTPSVANGAPSLGAGAPEPVDAKVRDAQKRAILVAELQQTRERHAQLVLEYNAGEPDLLGGEARNHQKYLDRLARLKAGIARAERDMDSLQRELSRLPSNPVTPP
jgi:hypothetical protein